MKRLLLIILVGTLLSSCGSQPTGEPGPSQIPESPSRGRCGDGVCDGPENPERCPQDCGVDVPEATVASPTACQLPNPIRASISTDILEWKDWLEDGSFEEGELQMVVPLSPSSVYKPPSVQPGPEAARTGSVGIRITAGPDQSGIVGIAALIEKGEATRFSFWVRSQGGQVRLEPKVYGVEKHISEVLDGPAEPGGMFEVGSEWTPIQFEIFNRQGLRFALLALQVGPDMTLDIDDVKIESQIWGMAEVNGPSRVVGEVDVPQTPVAPLHFSVLIHIEDPQALELSESYFQVQSTIFRELARTFNEHGGFLTIQPEEDWVLGAAIHEPQLLRELAQEYGVQ
ncbi:MAG: hypothetical protein GTO14_10585, partial [Anaerolineales bacterium]|nr:hypothetical protein [Anaerolineales bacterium]